MEQVYTTPKPARSVVVPNLKINLEVKRGATSRPVNHYDDRRVGLLVGQHSSVGTAGLRVTGHWVNDFGRVESGHGSV